MMGVLERIRQFLWCFVELAFLAVLALILIYLILGQDAGVFVSSVANNVLTFANGLQPQTLVGLAIVLALVFLILGRMKAPRMD